MGFLFLFFIFLFRLIRFKNPFWCVPNMWLLSDSTRFCCAAPQIHRLRFVYSSDLAWDLIVASAYVQIDKWFLAWKWSYVRFSAILSFDKWGPLRVWSISSICQCVLIVWVCTYPGNSWTSSSISGRWLGLHVAKNALRWIGSIQLGFRKLCRAGLPPPVAPARITCRDQGWWCIWQLRSSPASPQFLAWGKRQTLLEINAYMKWAILLKDYDHRTAPLWVGQLDYSQLQHLLHLLQQFSQRPCWGAQ